MPAIRPFLASLVLVGATFTGSVHAQSFEGIYRIGNTLFTARALSEQDRESSYFNIVYARGDKVGTMASLTHDPKFELVFDEHLGDRYLGTFYFVKAWKGRPLEGYYVRQRGGLTVPVVFVREISRDKRPGA